MSDLIMEDDDEMEPTPRSRLLNAFLSEETDVENISQILDEFGSDINMDICNSFMTYPRIPPDILKLFFNLKKKLKLEGHFTNDTLTHAYNIFSRTDDMSMIQKLLDEVDQKFSEISESLGDLFDNDAKKKFLTDLIERQITTPSIRNINTFKVLINRYSPNDCNYLSTMQLLLQRKKTIAQRNDQHHRYNFFHINNNIDNLSEENDDTILNLVSFEDILSAKFLKNSEKIDEVFVDAYKSDMNEVVNFFLSCKKKFMVSVETMLKVMQMAEIKDSEFRWGDSGVGVMFLINSVLRNNVFSFLDVFSKNEKYVRGLMSDRRLLRVENYECFRYYCLRHMKGEIDGRVVTNVNFNDNFPTLIIRNVDEFKISTELQMNILKILLSSKRTTGGTFSDAMLNSLKALFIDRKMDVCSGNNYAIKQACSMGYNTAVKFLLTLEGVQPDCGNSNPIRTASSKGHFEVVKLLLNDERVDVSTYEYESFRFACMKGHLCIVKLLIESSFVVDVSVKKQWAFRKACKFGKLNVVEYLLTLSEVDPSEKKNYGLKKAAAKGYLEIVKILLKDTRVTNKLPGVQRAIKLSSKNGFHNITSFILSKTKINENFLLEVQKKSRVKKQKFFENLSGNLFLNLPPEIYQLISSYMSIVDRITVIPNICKLIKSETNHFAFYWRSIVEDAMFIFGRFNNILDSSTYKQNVIEVKNFFRFGYGSAKKIFKKFLFFKKCIFCLENTTVYYRKIYKPNEHKNEFKPFNNHRHCLSLCEAVDHSIGVYLARMFREKSEYNYTRLFLKGKPRINMGDIEKISCISNNEAKRNIKYEKGKVGRGGYGGGGGGGFFTYSANENRFLFKDFCAYVIKKCKGNLEELKDEIELQMCMKVRRAQIKEGRDVLRMAIKVSDENNLKVPVKFYTSKDRKRMSEFDDGKVEVNVLVEEILKNRKKKKEKLEKKIKKKLKNFDFDVLLTKTFDGKKEMIELMSDFINGIKKKDNKRRRKELIKKLDFLKNKKLEELEDVPSLEVDLSDDDDDDDLPICEFCGVRHF